jgi:hypothetical protein
VRGGVSGQWLSALSSSDVLSPRGQFSRGGGLPLGAEYESKGVSDGVSMR